MLTAITAAFIDKDVSTVDKYWAGTCIQHNLMIPNGTAALKGLLESAGANFRYEIGLAVGEGDIVMVHGRYTAYGPKPLVAVDIFRVADGKIAEHWDVLQEETTETASGLSMFDTARPADSRRDLSRVAARPNPHTRPRFL